MIMKRHNLLIKESVTMPMLTQHYQLSFTTPAFLGNAHQRAQWRTPPIKSLMRQWWRVAVARSLDYRVADLLNAEQALFGAAADEFRSTKSKLRLRLDAWNEGTLKDWPNLSAINPAGVKVSVKPDLYLGYGPLEYNSQTRRIGIKNNAAIQAHVTANLALAYPDSAHKDMQHTIELINKYGALGGRSRNGWGSMLLLPADGTNGETRAPDQALDPHLQQDWRKALQLDWPHALGSDEQGLLVWQTEPKESWEAIMGVLAQLRIGMRAQFPFHTGGHTAKPEDRHWLSYPVTKHEVTSWGNAARLPNSLRFKVRPAPGQPEKLVGVLFHTPCRPPQSFNPDLARIQAVWQQVHSFLDNPEQQLRRIKA